MHNRVPTAREHALGVTLVLLVSLIWVLSAVLIQYIFSEYPKPYLMSSISSSLFSIFLTTVFFKRTGHTRLRETLLFSTRLAPLFFITIYTYNLGLAITSVASSSTISTLTTLFALCIGAFVGTEPFTLGKLIATAMTIVGVAIISSDDGSHKLFGDLLSLLSAFTYAVYGVMLKNRTAEVGDDLLHIQGFMGLVCALSVWPFLIFLHNTGFERFELPTPRMAALLLFNGLCCTVLSEFLFAKSVVLTSPMVSSLAISLTIPMSLFADSWVKQISFSLTYLVGTTLVLAAFLLVNWEMVRFRRKEAEDQYLLPEEPQNFVEANTS